MQSLAISCSQCWGESVAEPLWLPRRVFLRQRRLERPERWSEFCAMGRVVLKIRWRLHGLVDFFLQQFERIHLALARQVNCFAENPRRLLRRMEAH
jgi:hypothetical protein